MVRFLRWRDSCEQVRLGIQLSYYFFSYRGQNFHLSRAVYTLSVHFEVGPQEAEL
jgi:hypothetical protein